MIFDYVKSEKKNVCDIIVRTTFFGLVDNMTMAFELSLAVSWRTAFLMACYS